MRIQLEIVKVEHTRLGTQKTASQYPPSTPEETEAPREDELLDRGHLASTSDSFSLHQFLPTHSLPAGLLLAMVA